MEALAAKPPLDLPALQAGAVAVRPFCEQDVPAVTDAVADPELWRWLALSRPLQGADDVRVWMWESRRSAAAGAGVRLAVTYDGEFAGCVELTVYDNGVGAMGYWTVESMRGRGVARAALALVADWALDSGRCQMVDLFCLPGNEASVRVAVAAGFVPDGKFTYADPRREQPVTFDVFTRPVAGVLSSGS